MMLPLLGVSSSFFFLVLVFALLVLLVLLVLFVHSHHTHTHSQTQTHTCSAHTPHSPSQQQVRINAALTDDELLRAETEKEEAMERAHDAGKEVRRHAVV